jgi:hypothetical protein
MVLLRTDERENLNVRRRSLKPFTRMPRGQGRFARDGAGEQDRQ